MFASGENIRTKPMYARQQLSYSPKQPLSSPPPYLNPPIPSPQSLNHSLPFGYCKHCKRSQSTNMVQLLLSQNQNLKHQNIFLQQQVLKWKNKSREFVQTIEEYENIMERLNSKNSELYQEMNSISSGVASKIRGLKIGMEKRNRERLTVPVEDEGSEIGEKRLGSGERDRFKEKEKDNMWEKQNITNDYISTFKKSLKPKKRYDTQHDTNNFERLLSGCKHQQDPNMRKYLRKQLVDLTYQKSATLGYLDWSKQ